MQRWIVENITIKVNDPLFSIFFYKCIVSSTVSSRNRKFAIHSNLLNDTFWWKHRLLIFFRFVF